MIIRILVKVLVVFCLSGLSISSVFASSMDELLINSVRNNDMGMIRTAISNGANINCVAKATSPLLTAIETRNVGLVNYLLQNGANPNLEVKIFNGKTKVPLVVAVQHSKQLANYKMVQLLVNSGADVNDANGYGFTPLMAAVTNPPNIEMIQYLIEKGANVNQSDENGTTPLMIAAKFESGWGSVDTKTLKLTAAKILLKAGANPSKTDNDNNNALQYAVKTDFNAMVNLLLPVSPK